MPCSPASVSLRYPCDLTDAEWTHLAPLFPAASPARPAVRLAAAAARQRPLLRLTHWVCLALSAAGVSAGADDVHALPPGASAGRLATGPRGAAPRRPLGGDHGEPEWENHGRIRGHQGL
jgi:hypothetical protein